MDATLLSDAFGLSGGLVVLAPDWTIRGFDAFNPSGVIANHIAVGILGILGGAFHRCVFCVMVAMNIAWTNALLCMFPICI